MRCPRCKNACFVFRTRLWKLKTCSNECFSKSLRESVLGTRVNKYSSCSVSVGFAKGPRRTTARISADRLLCQGHRELAIRPQVKRRQAHTIHNAPADYARVIVTMLCINPHSVSSQMALNSRACLRHHAVLSGMLAGTIVPYHFEKESAGSAAALPSFRRPACAKNNAFLIARSNWKKHHMSERRNHFWIDRARERTSFWWQPLPDQDKQDLNSQAHIHAFQPQAPAYPILLNW